MQDMEVIYIEYFKTVNRYLFCLTHDSHISEELTQETFYRAVKKIHTFKGNSKMSVWLCQIAKNLWFDEWKKKKRYADTNEETMDKIQEPLDTEQVVILKEDKLSLYEKIKVAQEIPEEHM